MYIKIYFNESYYITYKLNENGVIIEKENCSLAQMIKEHGEPIKFMILIGV